MHICNTHRHGLQCNNCNMCGRLNCPTPPNPCKPLHHVQLPPCGEPSVWSAVQKLQCTVNSCVDQTNGVMENANRTLAAIKAAAHENGAYYTDRELWTETGYDSESGSKYFITHKKQVACDGSPLRMELKLAYDNTTNSRIKQDAFSASEFELANFMVPAIPVDDTIGWYGHATWKGAPIATGEGIGLYTVGFTRKGRMKYYDNAIDAQQLRRDNIENSLGCAGVLVVGSDIAPINMRNQIPLYDQNAARVCMGQNFETNEVIFLTCGEYDSNGMTSASCAAILKQYGCDLAVELCQGAEACGLDKGSMLFPTANNDVPKVYAYWFVSKKNTYCSNFTREIAVLMQKYGQSVWSNTLNSAAIAGIRDDISLILSRQNVTESDVGELKNLTALLSSKVQVLENSLDGLQGEVSELAQRLAQETQNRITEVTTLTAAINKEILDRQTAITNLQNQVDVLKNRADSTDTTLTIYDQRMQKHTADIATLNAELAALRATVNTNYNTMIVLTSGLRDDVGALQALTASLQTQFAQLDATLAAYQTTIAHMEQTVNDIKATLQLYNDRMNVIEDDHEKIHERMDALDELHSNLANTVAAMGVQVTTLWNFMNRVEPIIDDLKTSMPTVIQMLDNHEERINTLEEKMARLPDTHDDVLRIYMSPTGNDENTGLNIASKIKTFQRAFQIINSFRNVPLIRVLLDKGTYIYDQPADNASMNEIPKIYNICPANISIEGAFGGGTFVEITDHALAFDCRGNRLYVEYIVFSRTGESFASHTSDKSLLYTFDGVADILQCTFNGNPAMADGKDGYGYVHYNGIVTLRQCIFNNWDFSKYAIWCGRGSAMVNSCEFHNCTNHLSLNWATGYHNNSGGYTVAGGFQLNLLDSSYGVYRRPGITTAMHFTSYRDTGATNE